MINKKQKQVYDFIVSFIRKNGYAPSLQEIADNFSDDMAHPSSAHYHVKKLQEAGYLEREINKPRSIGVVPATIAQAPFLRGIGIDFVSIPIVGAANCGPATIFAEEYVEGYLKVSRRMVPKGENLYILRVEGDSMNRAFIRGEKSIQDGDFVLVDASKKYPESGDYVVAVIDGMGTVKKFIRDPEGEHILLVAESSSEYLPIYIHKDDAEDMVVAGTVIDVIKNPYKKT